MLLFLGILNKVDCLPFKRSNQLHKNFTKSQVKSFFEKYSKKRNANHLYFRNF